MTAPIEYINPPALSRPNGFSHVTHAPIDRMVFISGQVANDANGNVVGAGDIAAQTRQVFVNLGHALEAAGSGFDRLLKLNLFVRDLSEASVAAIRQVRREFLIEGALPASTLVGVTALARPALLLEVEAYALRRD